MSQQYKPWWSADEGMVCKAVHAYVRAVEDEQSDIFDRFVKLNALYDPNANNAYGRPSDQLGVVTENVIASNVDTVAAVVAATDVRPEFMTDGADWSHQLLAKDLGFYAEQLKIDLGIMETCRIGFKLGGALKGTAVNKVFVDEFSKIRVERRVVDNVIVDETECEGGGKPKQMHFWMRVDREELKMLYPDHDAAIDRAPRADDRRGPRSAQRKHLTNAVMVLESIRLPLGVKGTKRYRPGRRVVSLPDVDLLDEKWHKPHFGCAVMVWSEREDGFYGISGAERIAGHQRALNKRNWQIDRQLDQSAVPTTYVRTADANLSVKTVNRLGSIAVIKGEPPVTVAAPAVHAETYQSRVELRASAFEEFGMSMLTAQAKKPAGIDSGVAMREYRDQTTQRFALQEKAFEKFVLDTVLLVLDCCKDLGDEAPSVMRRSRYGIEKIDWSDVDMGDLKVQIQAASELAKTPAGRKQFALELAQAGVISTDEYRRLLGHPDIDRAMTLYTSALESIEFDLEAIARGRIVMPEPFNDLKMAVWRGERQYNDWRQQSNVPEEIMEALRSYIVNAAWMDSQANAPGPQMPQSMGADQGAAAAMAPPDPMSMGMAAAPGSTPTPSLSPQAMQTLPS